MIFIKRTISAMVGKGSVNHNSRKFRAENVDGERTHLNVDYCNENIKKIYHELFDEALKRYNEKQTRADRRIENYYEKIRTGKQEKLFHELILQIGDKENMAADGKNADLARVVLDEYYQGFQERNPHLRVFSAHLHMYEATPHLHIDFVPFTTGSKRGLDTRVSLKQALAAQGFKGGTHGDTEWNQWVQSEKEQLEAVMERHGIEWEHKGTHEQHLSVMDFKKQEREKEVIALDEQIATKRDEVKSLGKRVQNFDGGLKELQKVEQALEFDDAFQLPEPQSLMSAKTYKTRFADPLVKKLKALVKKLLGRCFEALDNYHRLNAVNGTLYRENERLSKTNGRLANENEVLRAENRDYKLLRKVFGSRQIDDLIEQARQSKQREKRFRNHNFERKERTMEKKIYDEKNGLWYELRGDYYYPLLELPEEEQRPVSVWGQRHLRYIREHKKSLHFSLLTSGKLNSYLADIDQQAQEMYLRLVEQMAECEGVTEQLKAEDQIRWVGLMNNIADRAREIANTEIIYC